MARRRSIWLVAAAMVVLSPLGAVSASAAPAPVVTATNAVIDWNVIALNTVTTLPGPAGGAPPASQISMGMVQGAVYDAVNAIGPKRYRPYLLKRRFGATASKEAAVATAAHAVLSNIVSTVPASVAFPTRETLLQSLASQYAASLGAVPDSPAKTRGVAAGNAAADAMISARADDGRFGPSPWVSNTAPGHWQPLVNPATGQPVLDPTPWVGDVQPFLLRSPAQVRTAGPLPLGSAAYAAEFNEVKALGSVNSTDRTAAQTYIAGWWQSTPVASWNAVARDLSGRRKLTLVDSARLLAMANLSAGDAAIGCWNDKYHWDFWRPWNAIPRAAEDGNPATTAEAGWTPLITAPYPDHPSGHLCLDGAYAGVLRMFFGDRIRGGYQITSTSPFLAPGDPRTRSFDSFSQALAEVMKARVWAGLHFRTADVQGERLGRSVARYAAAHYFQPVGGRG